MNEMVERVARAICQRLRVAGLAIPGMEWHNYEIDAHAAIAAMREPTEAMITAGYDSADDYTDNDSAVRWRAMIDAALKE